MVRNTEDQVLWEAEFNPKVRTYWLLSGAFFLFVSVVGIPLLPFWFMFGYSVTGRYLKRMRCTLTAKNLQMAKGVFIRMEKTVPLDKSTDLGLVQGPIMRHYGLQALSVETAGQSSQGALVKLLGVVNTEAFREAVLAQRDKLVAALSEGKQTPSPLLSATTPTTDALLTEIRDVLHRIERNLSD